MKKGMRYALTIIALVAGLGIFSGDLSSVLAATVTVVDVDTDKETVYHIVGEDEADISKNLISYKTPIAKGLLGKHEGDEIDIKIPKGTISYDVVKVEYI